MAANRDVGANIIAGDVDVLNRFNVDSSCKDKERDREGEGGKGDREKE